ncbi:TetR/AcrR family transcriptional regulator [Streptomyces antimycoticus]|uniref:TetR family transcriptional regulator n=1 Tax=Streptomyces antimycoticus TaxID=68175 RepID=A0A4D4K5V5_9ACTN|nr:TetR/AcrR family transcriptional regulator [Streptomyces antimycoticus]BBJ44911.1 TetR family transcriptional regulator [Streptomyces antimycoticus]GDY41629.1 TetR family transcriptional regulator [Streptomyces antimycoticus]
MDAEPKNSGGGIEPWGDITPDAARRLVSAAVHAFAERGYHATTTRDIASRAGMSPAALYIHYKTKEELLYQISKVGHERALEIVERERDSAGTPAERLARAVRAFVRWHAEHHMTARVVQYELGALAEEHHAEVIAVRKATDGAVRSIIEDGVKAGAFDVPEVRGATVAVLSLCIDVARWFNARGRSTPDEVGDLYAGLVLRMVGADGGQDRRP